MAKKYFPLWVVAEPSIRDFPERRAAAETSLSVEISLVGRKVKSQHLFISLLIYVYKNNYSRWGSQETADDVMKIAGITNVNEAEI